MPRWSFLLLPPPPFQPPFHLPERTCKVFTRIYGRFSIHNRGVPWKIKRHPSWPRTSAYQSIDVTGASLSLSLSFYFGARSLLVLLFSTPSAFRFDFPILYTTLFDFFPLFFFLYCFQTIPRNGKGTLRRYHCRIFAWQNVSRKPLVLSSFDAARARTKLQAYIN